MSDPVIHLTVRAVEWLHRIRFEPGTAFETPAAVTACGADREKRAGPKDWCRVEDVRALVHGNSRARLWDVDRTRSIYRDVTIPTCPRCAVLLDQALETPESVHPRSGVWTK